MTAFYATSGDRLRISVEKGLIKLPEDLTAPIICVGPGTGVAPMRSVIEERVDAGSNGAEGLIQVLQTDSDSRAALTLYFGCRSEHKDQHYGAEWKMYSENGQIAYRVAFSRDGPEGSKRTYVQDLLKQDKERVWDLLGEQQGTLIISG